MRMPSAIGFVLPSSSAFTRSGLEAHLFLAIPIPENANQSHGLDGMLISDLCGPLASRLPVKRMPEIECGNVANHVFRRKAIRNKSQTFNSIPFVTN